MAKKETIYERDKGRCRYCGCMLELWQATTDHVIPRKEGGSNRHENIVIACPRCNAVKGDRTPEESGMRLWSLEELEVAGDGAHGPDDTQDPFAPIPPRFFDVWPYPQDDITVNEFDMLYRDFKSYQQMRIRRENYMRSRRKLGLEVHPRLAQSLLIYENLEKQAEKDLELVREDYLWPAFEEVKGIGVVLAAGIRGLFDPLKFANVQKAWKYAGYAVIDGEGQRKRKGQKAGFCVPFKTRLWQAVDCMIRTKSEPWYGIYRKYKAKQLWLHRHDGTLGNKDGKGIRGHAHNRAVRFLAKRLIKHLWCHAHKAPMSEAEL